ncbi:MAG TPA: DUF4412 domain-containing protein [Flavobacteriales bacterium]
MLKQLLLPFAIACCTILHAQVDLNTILQQSGSGVQMVPDTDPFIPNTFVGSFRMVMTVQDGRDQPSTHNVHYFSSADHSAMRMGEGQQSMTTITDHKGKWTYMLMNHGSQKQALKTAKMKVVDARADAPTDPPEITVTNETKAIDGHTCTRMIVKNEDGTWTGWVAKDIDAPFSDIARSLGASGGQEHKGLDQVKGFPLEYEWVDVNGTDRLSCTVKDLKLGAVDASVFSLEGYQVMELPAMGR